MIILAIFYILVALYFMRQLDRQNEPFLYRLGCGACVMIFAALAVFEVIFPK